MLSEIYEADATGEVAATYSRIKQVQGITVVNLIWRHLATIDGALAWAWPAVEQALPAIQAATGRALALADRLVAEHGLAEDLAPTLRPRGAVADIVEIYNRGNCFNMLAMTSLAAVRAGAPAPRAQGDAPEPGAPTGFVPPMPRYDTLNPAEQRAINALAEAGPARESGVRPSLWVHLALWPETLHAAATACAPVLSGAGFGAAHAALRDGAVPLLGLPSIEAKADASPIDVAIGRFRQRIPEMLLIGRALRGAALH